MRVKICGVMSARDALACADAGADAIGLNFVPGSRRRVDEERAREIVRAVGERVLVVGVVADLEVQAMLALRERVGLGCLQLHGDEPVESLVPLLPHAYKAIRVGGPEDVALAETYPGPWVMVDAKAEGALGGTGRTFDWNLVAVLAGRRKVVLAGGLTPDNVAEAVRVVRPDCVDVASGVEVDGHPGQKDVARVRDFIAQARSGAPGDRPA
jgi:phosphoribosylanthranilate isomerase